MGCLSSWAAERRNELRDITKKFNLDAYRLCDDCLDIAEKVHQETKLIGEDLAIVLKHRVEKAKRMARIAYIVQEISILQKELNELVDESL